MARNDFRKAREFISDAESALRNRRCTDAFEKVLAVHRFTFGFSRERTHTPRNKISAVETLQRARNAVTSKFLKTCVVRLRPQFTEPYTD